MLYDPKWEVEHDRVYAGVSLRKLVAWLETQSPETHYSYFYPKSCVMAQFLQATTGCLINEAMVLFDGKTGEWLNTIARGDKHDHEREWTFGAALERARKELARL